MTITDVKFGWQMVHKVKDLSFIVSLIMTALSRRAFIRRDVSW